MQTIKYEPIKGRKNFLSVFEKGRKFYEQNASAVIIFRLPNQEAEENSPHIVHYAVSVSKKTAKKAVIRNRIKRLLRVCLKKIEYEHIVFIDKIFVNWRTAPKHPALISLKDVLPEVESLVRRANDFYRRNLQNKKK